VKEESLAVSGNARIIDRIVGSQFSHYPDLKNTFIVAYGARERGEKEKKKCARRAARTFSYLLARLGVENAPPPLPPPRLGRFRARAAETRRSGRATARSAASTRRDASQCVAGFFIDSDSVSCRMLRFSAARAPFA
jgi:hypothetical protein